MLACAEPIPGSPRRPAQSSGDRDRGPTASGSAESRWSGDQDSVPNASGSAEYRFRVAGTYRTWLTLRIRREKDLAGANALSVIDGCRDRGDGDPKYRHVPYWSAVMIYVPMGW